MSMNVDIAMTIFSSYTKSLDLSTPEDVISLARNTQFTDGTGSGKANRHWSDSRSLNASAQEVLDLEALTDAFGQTLTFTKIKFIYIKNTSTTAAQIAIGGAEVPLLFFIDITDKLLLYPDGDFRYTFPTTGLTVSSANQLKIEEVSGNAAAIYEIILIGEGTVA